MPDKAERALLKKQMEARGMFPGGTPTFPMDGAHGAGNSNSLPRIITFGSMPSYREDKMIELKQQQQSKSSQTPTGLPPPPPPISMPPSAPSSAQHIYPKENRKDSATSPVDPSLMDLEDELLLMDDNTPARFIELSPNNLPKLSVKPDRQSGRWASILSQTLPLADLATAANAPPPAVTSAAANSISTPLVLTDEHLHHSRHSLHRQSSQGSAGSESPLTEMERTLKSFNGYHEDILEALQSVSQQRQHHQKSLECIRTPGGSSSGATVGPGGGDGSGPASLGRQTPNELKKAFLESDYGGQWATVISDRRF